MTEIKRIIIPKQFSRTAIQDLIRELDDAIPEWELTYDPPAGNYDNPSIRLERKDDWDY